MTRTQRILELLAATPDGMAGADIGAALHGSPNKCGRLAMQMSLAGTLHRAKTGNTCRYFLAESDRDRMVPVLAQRLREGKVEKAEQHKARAAERKRLARRGAKAKAKARPGPQPQPMAPRSRHAVKPKAVPMAARDVAGMDTARRTVSKAPLDSRYFVDPTKPIVGGWLDEFRTRCAAAA